MLAQAKSSYVYVGVQPPTNPDAATLWLSTSLKDVRIPNGIADRKPIITPTQTWEGAYCNEPNIWYDATDALTPWHMIYTGGSSGTSALGYAKAPTPFGPWTKYASNPVLGQGGSGFAHGAFHSNIYIEGSTIYCTFTDAAAMGTIKVATAALSNPTAWTVQGSAALGALPPGATDFGNSNLLKVGTGNYIMFFDALSSNWQAGFATGSSPLGPFTTVQFPISAIWVDAKYQSGGGICSFLENGSYIIYYHLGPLNTGTPTDGFRAFTDDLVNWTVDLNGYPLLKRMAPYEVDQVADLFLAQGPNEGWWAVWSAMDNASQVSAIMCAPVYPTMKRWDGYAWANIESVSDAQAGLDYVRVMNVQTAAYTLNAREDAAFDPTSGNLTATLPHAAKGSFCRVTHASASVNTVSCALQGTDAILGSAVTLATGTTATFYCYTQGKWNRIS